MPTVEEIIGPEFRSKSGSGTVCSSLYVTVYLKETRKRIESESQLRNEDSSSSSSKKIDKNNSLLIKNTFSHTRRAKEPERRPSEAPSYPRRRRLRRGVFPCNQAFAPGSLDRGSKRHSLSDFFLLTAYRQTDRKSEEKKRSKEQEGQTPEHQAKR